MKEVIRYDAARPIRMDKTPEGYLRGEVPVTRAGIFLYRRSDGSMKRELRHPLDVFDSDSLDSLKQVPVTMDHPDGLVTAANSKELGVGMTGENVRIKDGWVVVTVTITDAATVQRIEAGKRPVSMGYRAVVSAESGRYDGEEYDSRQRTIRYNHLAIVDSARAGQGAAIRLDSSAAVEIEDEEMGTENTKLVAIRVDGLDYQGSPEVARALEKTEKAIADANSAKAAAEAALVTAKAETEKEKGRADAAEAKVTAIKDSVPALVKARTKLLGIARAVVDAKDFREDATDEELMKLVIKKRSPEAKLDGVSAEYLQARFDSVAETVTDAAIAAQRSQAQGAGGGQPPAARTDGNLSPREKMVADMKAASSGEAKK